MPSRLEQVLRGYLRQLYPSFAALTELARDQQSREVLAGYYVWCWYFWRNSVTETIGIPWIEPKGRICLLSPVTR